MNVLHPPESRFIVNSSLNDITHRRAYWKHGSMERKLSVCNVFQPTPANSTLEVRMALAASNKI